MWFSCVVPKSLDCETWSTPILLVDAGTNRFLADTDFSISPKGKPRTYVVAAWGPVFVTVEV